LKLAFSRSNAIWTININGTGETPLLVSGTEPAWSPDGTRIAYSGTGGLWVMNPDGTNPARIYTDIINFPLCCDHHYRNPAWQPVAQTPNTFIISGRITDKNNIGLGGVVVNLSGSANGSTTADQIGNYSFSALSPGGSYTVSPSALNRYFIPANQSFTNLDSNKVVNFSMSRVCVGLLSAQNGKISFARSGEIFTVNPDGSGVTNITNDPASDNGPDWSPDGNGLIFYSNRDGNNEIYRKSSEDAPPVRLTNNTVGDFSPRFSPDGASIVFVSDRDGDWEIYKMNADGSNQVRLTNNAAFESSPRSPRTAGRSYGFARAEVSLRS
jgi:TolB protein